VCQSRSSKPFFNPGIQPKKEVGGWAYRWQSGLWKTTTKEKFLSNGRSPEKEQHSGLF
jgi:hypothetical protein